MDSAQPNKAAKQANQHMETFGLYVFYTLWYNLFISAPSLHILLYKYLRISAVTAGGDSLHSPLFLFTVISPAAPL